MEISPRKIPRDSSHCENTFSYPVRMIVYARDTLPDEEELIRLLGFAVLAKINEFTIGRTELDLHYPTEKLKTPLVAAIDRGDVKILEILVNKYPVELDSTVTQPCGKTALMHASYVTRNIEILDILISRGAGLHKTDARGWNCLYYAIVGERLANVKYLLESGANVNSQDAEGRTPLMIAVILSNSTIAKLLLDQGANSEARDNFGYSALRLAILRKKQEHAMLLIENGNSDGAFIPSDSTKSDYDLAEYLMPDLSQLLTKKLM